MKSPTQKKVRKVKSPQQEFVDRQMNMILDNRERTIYPLFIRKAGRNLNTK